MAQRINQTQYGKEYSTTEQLTGDVWIDGKPIYRKTVSTGALPNNTTKSVAHGITGVDDFINIYGYCYGGGLWYPLPFMETGSASSYSTRLRVNTTNIEFTNQNNSSSLSASYVTLEYTKT